MMTCINCTEEVLGDYCQNCGQKREVGKLTFRSLVYDLQQRVLGFDSRVFRTIKDLTIKPEKVVHDFREGVRVKYVGPVGYYFLLLTIFVLLISALDIDMAEYTAVTSSILGPQSAEQKEAQSAFQDTAFGNFRVISFIMIPWFILATYLLFRRSKLNIIETSVFTFYVQAQPMLLSIFGLFIFKFFDAPSIIAYVTPISFLYYAYAAMRFYKHNHPVWAFSKGILSVIFGLCFFFLFVMIVGMVAMFVNPEATQNFLNIK